MKKLTDAEVVKALECCIAKENCEEVSCENCPLERTLECKEVLFQNILELINRKDAEIEVLKKIQQKVLSEQGSYTTNDRTVCDDCERLWLDSLLKAKSEAYKELAERLKEKRDGGTYPYVLVNVIDNLLKELTEGGNEDGISKITNE